MDSEQHNPKPDYKVLQKASEVYLKQRRYAFVSTPKPEKIGDKLVIPKGSGSQAKSPKQKVKGKSARRAMKKARRLAREQNNV